MEEKKKHVKIKKEYSSPNGQRMSRVKSKDTLEENLLAKALWSKGVRYRRNFKGLPGTPDIVISRYKLAIFVDGEFWHGFDWEKRKHDLKTNRDFWISKITANMERDEKVNDLLAEQGWLVMRFWSKQIRKYKDECVNKIIEVINCGKSKDQGVEI